MEELRVRVAGRIKAVRHTKGGPTGMAGVPGCPLTICVSVSRVEDRYACLWAYPGRGRRRVGSRQKALFAGEGAAIRSTALQ
jgi:hypothetical protein